MNWNKLMRKSVHLLGLSHIYVSHCMVQRMWNLCWTLHRDSYYHPSATDNTLYVLVPTRDSAKRAVKSASHHFSPLPQKGHYVSYIVQYKVWA